jgi:hypothetical protein
MQGMMDNLSQPVAFATVPLSDDDPAFTSQNLRSSSTPRRESSLGSSDGEVPEAPKPSIFSKTFGFPRVGRSKKPSAGSATQTEQVSEQDIDFDDGIFDEGRHFAGLMNDTFELMSVSRITR